jgi:acyl-CoA synthetase (AMP-forming)/AMP-acid ligase II
MAALTQSYVHGASVAPLIGETIGALLDRVTAEGPDRPAFVARHQGVRWTYAELNRRVDDLAAGLLALGLESGDCIGIWSPNNSEWVLAQFATAKAYGMTETSPVSFQSALDDPLDRRVSTGGRVQPHIEVKIVDSQGRIVPPGVTGELSTRGYSVMRGCWGDPAGTAAAIDAARFMHTGDLATIDAEGYGNIVGRLKDMVIRGGENVYPREVEEFLYSHPAIADVQVFGVPDPRYGEELCAWVKLRDGAALSEAEVIAFCRASIAHYKAPKYVRFVQEFPMTVTGKVQKFQMRQAMIDALALKVEKTA